MREPDPVEPMPMWNVVQCMIMLTMAVLLIGRYLVYLDTHTFHAYPVQDDTTEPDPLP